MKAVLDLGASDWKKEVLESDVLTVVDFWHEHCLFCLKLNPVFEEVAIEFRDKIKFAKLNVLETKDNRRIAVEHGIMSTPTLLFFCEGRAVGQALGFMPKEKMKSTLDAMLASHKECVKQSTPLET
ncbi:thioredoxin fold domain-containing protein [Candidatus Bathyarchaeota archaeon]|nr:thioredoxin fold domain-containing protein [Candidatus Bathyarchaeota archaeon]